MSGLVRFAGLSLLRRSPLTALSAQQALRAISTSPKNRETVSVPKEQTKTTHEAESKNWVSYGFSTTNQTEDRNSMKSSFFFSVTLCLVWGTLIWAYLPDIHLRDWSQREAYLELRRREAAGLDPISRDFINADQMVLPSEEELGEMEIII